MTEVTDLLLWGILAHLVADWPLQTEWMAIHKRNLHHPAAWVHSGVHCISMALVFPWYLAILIAGSHLLIDTRKPVLWWMQRIKGMATDDPHTVIVETGVDQVFHITVVALIALYL